VRILIYSHAFAPKIGGVETYVMLLACGLTQNRSRTLGADVDVTLVTRTPKDKMNDAGLPFRIVRRPGLLELLRLIQGADVIQLAGPVILPMLLGLLLRKPVVVEHHGYQAVCPNGLLFYEPLRTVCPGHFMAGRHNKCLECNAADGKLLSLKMWLLTFARRWLCLHVRANTPITFHLQRRIALPRSAVIYYGIEVSKTRQRDTAHQDGPNGSVCFGYVGRLVREKGASLLADAAARLRARGYQFRLKFIGDGPERAGIEARVRSAGLSDRTVFTGFLGGEELEQALQEVAAVVMPSVWEETAGLAAIEQMMKGRLVIVSDIGGLGEVVDDAGMKFAVGDVVALEECLQQVIERPALTCEIGVRARARALKLFRQDEMVNNHLRVYGGLGGES